MSNGKGGGRQPWLLAVAVLGAARIAWFHFVAEGRRAARQPHRIGAAFEPVRPFLVGQRTIGFVSDEPIDVRPPIRHQAGDELHGEAQYVLAPTILSVGAAGEALALVALSDPVRLDDVLVREHLRVVRSFGPRVHLAAPK